jgi:hypothetical protein
MLRRSAGPHGALRRTAAALALALCLAAAGCAHRGLNLPGPTDRMGHDPAAPGPQVAKKASPKAQPRRAERRQASAAGDRVAVAAGELVGMNPLIVNGEKHRYDCSGFVIAAYAGAGLPLRGSTRDMYEKAEAWGLLHEGRTAKPGEVVFFDNTYDRNHNRRRDDDLSHIAIVERVLPDGTMTLVHLGSDGVVRIAMNLKHPDVRVNDAGEVINSYIRPSRDAKTGPVLTGALFRGFAPLYDLPQGEDDTGAVSDLR